MLNSIFIQANIIRSNLLKQISTELNSKNSPGNKMKINSKTRDEMNAIYDTLEITIDNPMEMGKPRHLGHLGSGDLHNSLTANNLSIKRFTPSIQNHEMSLGINDAEIEQEYLQNIPHKKMVLSQLKFQSNNMQNDSNNLNVNEHLLPLNINIPNDNSKRKLSDIKEICDTKKKKRNDVELKAFQVLYNVAKNLKDISQMGKSKKKSPEKKRKMNSFRKCPTLELNDFKKKEKKKEMQKEQRKSPNKKVSFAKLENIFDQINEDTGDDASTSDKKNKGNKLKEIGNLKKKESMKKISPFKIKHKASASSKEIISFIAPSYLKTENGDEVSSDDSEENNRSSIQIKNIKKIRKSSNLNNLNTFRIVLHSSSILENPHKSIKSKKYSDTSKILNARKMVQLFPKDLN